jgi:predicted PurR-regulated permease PerM
VIDFWEKHLFPKQTEKAKADGLPCAAGPRAVSLLLTWILIGFAVYLLMSFLLPELYRSVMQLIGNLENYYNIVVGWIEGFLHLAPEAEAWLGSLFEDSYNGLLSFVTNELMPKAQQIVGFLSGSVRTVVGLAMDLLVGLIVSVYLLATKERLAAHGRKMVCSLLSPRKTVWFFRGLRKVDDIFAGFVRGKLLDSLIIGLICFVGCQLLRFPYTPLISVIVGVTNVIPFFGPFLGAIPSTFLILLVSPMQAVYFVIFVLALQQVDGNIIGPKILGDKTGLSSLWVITAILVGGGFFGLAGMFFGVPVFACLYCFSNFLIKVRLRKRGLPVETRAYQNGVPARGVVEEPEDFQFPEDP